MATYKGIFPEKMKNGLNFNTYEVWKTDFPDFISIKQTVLKTLRVLYQGHHFLN